MDTEFIVMLIIVCILICQFIDRIQMIRIEDKIDELKQVDACVEMIIKLHEQKLL